MYSGIDAPIRIKYLTEFEFAPPQEIDKSTKKLADYSGPVVKDFEKCYHLLNCIDLS